MKKEEYGDNFQEHLLEQYKLFVETSNKVSNRRGETNIFYITILSILFTALSIIIEVFRRNISWELIVLFCLGFALCFIWCINLSSYKKLNKGKFEIIFKIEKLLPFNCFEEEWNELQKGRFYNRYKPLTTIEQCIPIIFIVLFILLIIIFLSSLKNPELISPEMFAIILNNLN
ncbi:MAG: RipA family octameric membrane protein [Candidatus Helarchaeota archaeon]